MLLWLLTNESLKKIIKLSIENVTVKTGSVIERNKDRYAFAARSIERCLNASSIPLSGESNVFLVMTSS